MKKKKVLSPSEFNDKYPVGSCFIYQPIKFLRGGLAVRTTKKAVGDEVDTVVEIDNPTKSIVSIADLTPSG